MSLGVAPRRLGLSCRFPRSYSLNPLSKYANQPTQQPSQSEEAFVPSYKHAAQTLSNNDQNGLF